MKISNEIKRIVEAYNISEPQRLKMEKELQEYVDKRIKEMIEQQRKQWAEEMKRIAKKEWMKMIESKREIK